MSMSRIFAVMRAELKAQFMSPVVYIFLIAFWILHGFFALRVSSFFDAGQASIDGAMVWHPWLWLVLVPAVGMHLWADERRDGTIELLFTLPMTVGEAVVAKFLASCAVIVLALLGTMPFVCTVAYLGSPDWGPILTGYIGSALLAFTSLAITSMMSSLTRSHVVGFILSLVTLLTFTLIGWDRILEILNTAGVPTFLIEFCSSLSTLMHFINFQKGLLDCADVIYFVSMIALFLFFTARLLDQRWNWKQRLPIMGVGILCCVAVNVIVAFFPMEFDWTADRSYSLSPAAKRILAKVSDETPVTITLYFSETSPDISPSTRTFATRIWTLLEEIAGKNKNITVRKVNPLPDTEAEDAARANGLQGTPLISGEQVYFGLVFKCIEQSVTLPALVPGQESQFEYQIVSAVAQVTRETKPEIAILTEVPLLQEAPAQRGQPDQSWIVFKELQKNHSLRFVSDAASVQALDCKKTPLLFVFHPVDLDTAVNFAIDQYLLRGGKLIVATDCAPASLPMDPQSRTMSKGSSFNPFWSHWGVTMTQEPVSDLLYTHTDQRVGSIFLPRVNLRETAISRDLNVSSNLKELTFYAPGGMTFEEPNGAEFEAQSVFHSSDSAFPYPLYLAAQQSPILVRDVALTPKRKYELGLLLSGKFTTAFPELAKDSGITASQTPSSVLLLSDIDFFCNPLLVRVDNTPFGQMITPINDNFFFIQNAIDMMTGDQDLIDVRVKPVSQRPLQKIVDMMRVAAEQRQAQISQYEQKLRNVMQEINSLRTPNSTQVILSNDAQTKLKSLEKSRREINDELKKQRRALRADIDRLQNRIELINILLIPLLVALLAAILLVYRSRKCGAL